ncbi:MAG: ATP-binding cassette domain-containing protein [Treponema sp.]|jgi:ABC-type multidrug transport system fused ATPase/permease subunit|nr:ATP-binding cassette domain-containing protein [Treponema sp.]
MSGDFPFSLQVVMAAFMLPASLCYFLCYLIHLVYSHVIVQEREQIAQFGYPTSSLNVAADNSSTKFVSIATLVGFHHRALNDLTKVSFEYTTKRFQNAAANAIDDVSLSIEAGEFITIIGASGCGKTTLLSFPPCSRLFSLQFQIACLIALFLLLSHSPCL